MFDNHQKFNNISSGLQNLVLVIAIIIGGIWTAFTFSTLKTKYKAQAEITDLELKNAKAKDEYSEKGAVIDISLDAKQEFLNNKNGYFISVLAKITNSGVKNTFVNLSKENPLIVYKISFNRDGTSFINPVLTQSEYNLSSIVMRSGYTIQSLLFVNVDTEGLYIVEYRIKLDKNERRIDNEKRGENTEDVYWTGKTYVLIK